MKDNGLVLLKEYIDEFGYHSDRELDITYKCYYEDIERIITKLKNSLESLTLECDFEEEQYLKYEDQMKKISSKKLRKNISEMRDFLWWREELKDLSIRYYCLIKKYTDRLASAFKDSNIIKDKTDIYYLKQTDILDFIDEKIDISKLNEIITKNKIYYNSFKNFNNPTDIGSVYTENVKESKEYIDILKGIGCNDKIVTGKVKIVEKVENIDTLTSGDILVTKYIDTGWTSRFGILKGVISEYGGVLCHSSIVAREYSISAIVCAKDVCSKLTDGDIIEMNGKTGEIKVLKEGE
jgi:pyruvate,water dikinase